MENEELENLWKKYDSKLDNLEMINKKLIKEMLIKKPAIKLNRQKFLNSYGVIISTICLAIILHPYYSNGDIDWRFITGCTIILLILIFQIYSRLKSYLIIQSIDLSNDSVIDSSNKIIEFKKVVRNKSKYTILSFPILFLGLLFITRYQFSFEIKSVTILIGVFVSIFLFIVFDSKRNKNEIARLEKEINNLKEYI